MSTYTVFKNVLRGKYLFESTRLSLSMKTMYISFTDLYIKSPDHLYLFVLVSHRLVLHELHLQSGYLCPEGTDLLAGSVLVHHHFILDITRPVCVFQSV